MSDTLTKQIKKRFAGNAWLRWAGAPMFAALLVVMVAAPLARADGSLGHLLGMQESSKLAKAYEVLPESFYPTSVAWSPDGKYIADTGILTRTIHVWDVKTKRVVQTLENVPPLGSFQALAWSPDGQYLVGCGRNMRIWNTTNWNLVKDNAMDSQNDWGCSAIAFSSDGRWLAVGPHGPSGGQTCVYNARTWNLKQCTNFPPPAVHGFVFSTDKVAFRPGTDQLAIAVTGWFRDPDKWDGRMSGPPSGRVLFWDVDGAPPNLREDGLANSLLAYPDGIKAIAYSPDGRQLATGSIHRTKAFPGNTVVVWDASTHAMVATPLGGPSEDAADNSALTYTADGRYLLAAFRDTDGPIHIIDAYTLRPVDTVHAFNVSMFAIAVEPNGPRFVVTSGRNLIIWTLRDNR